MTAELLTVFFSHPRATGLWHWSFMDDRKGGHPQALFSFDGRPRPEAEQWIKMMEEDFNTDETLRTGENGVAVVQWVQGDLLDHDRSRPRSPKVDLSPERQHQSEMCFSFGGRIMKRNLTRRSFVFQSGMLAVGATAGLSRAARGEDAPNVRLKSWERTEFPHRKPHFRSTFKITADNGAVGYSGRCTGSTVSPRLKEP